MNKAERATEHKKTNKLLQIVCNSMKEMIKVPGVRGAIWTR